MVQKRPFGEEELYEVSSKQPRHLEPSCQLVSVLEFSRESGALKPYASGGDEDNSSTIKPDTEKKSDSHNVAHVPFQSEKEFEMGIHGSTSNSSWATSSTSEEDIRSEAPLHILISPEFYNLEHPFKAVTHPAETYSSLLENPPRKMVPIGPDFQAEIPECDAYGSKGKLNLEGINNALNLSSQALKSDFVDYIRDESKLVGISIIPMDKMELPADHGENIGVGRVKCPCEDVGSIRCVRQHIMDAREKLKLTLGEETFARLGFFDMGEVVAERWSEEEEELFQEVVFSNPVSLGKNFWHYLDIEFPSRTRKELVSYYFNVFMLQKRAEQNRFDPLNIDSDNDEWQEIDAAVAANEEAKLTEDEDSVVESPAFQNGISCNVIYENGDKQTYDEDAGGAAWKDYKPADFGSRKVFTDVSESCPDNFDNNSSSKLNIQPSGQGQPNKVGEQVVQDRLCTTVAPGITSESSVQKTDNSKHWASNFAGMGSGSGHDFVLEPCSGKEWDVGFMSCAKNKVDLLPTHTMIEEVFGDGAWTYKSRDGQGLS